MTTTQEHMRYYNDLSREYFQRFQRSENPADSAELLELTDLASHVETTLRAYEKAARIYQAKTKKGEN